jgi:hypothetical protein
MFEHRRQPLLPRRIFYARLARSAMIAGIILFFSLTVGICGYHFLEHMPLLDAFLNASMILSGMGPVGELKTAAGKFFAGCYALFSGLAFISSIGIVVAPLFHRFIHRFHLENESARDR